MKICDLCEGGTLRDILRQQYALRIDELFWRFWKRPPGERLNLWVKGTDKGRKSSYGHTGAAIIQTDQIPSGRYWFIVHPPAGAVAIIAISANSPIEVLGWTFIPFCGIFGPLIFYTLVAAIRMAVTSQVSGWAYRITKSGT